MGQSSSEWPRARHFCSGPYCPGLHRPASETPHPNSCAMRALNSNDQLRSAATARRELGRSVSFDVPVSP